MRYVAVITLIWFLFLPLYASEQTAEQATLQCTIATTPLVIDGELNEECWQLSPKTTNFYDHETAATACEKTEAMICCDSKQIYIAFRCYDSQPDKIKAEQKVRGGAVDTDDWVQVYIDPYHDKSGAVWFRVTPRGVQCEELQTSQGGKIEWIGDWKAGVKRLPDGYSVEMAIPFSILKYNKQQHSMGIAYRRNHARTVQGWTAPDIGPNHEIGRYFNWNGITPPEPVIRPLILGYSLVGTGDGFNHRVTSGMDIKQMIGNGLSGVLTLNPDFRNVEQAVGSISFSYSEKYLPDSRPFFLEGSNYFPGSTMFYSQRIKDIDLGAKLVGKQGKYSYAFLDTGKFGSDNNLVGQVGLRNGEKNGYWLAATRTDQQFLNNTAYHTSMWQRLYKNGDNQLTGDISFYRSSGGTDRSGDKFRVGLNSMAPSGKLRWTLSYDDIDPNFYPALGIEEETDKRGLSAWMGINRRPSQGKWRETEIGTNLDFFDRHDGTTFTNKIGGYISGDMQNGWSGIMRCYVADRPPNRDRILNAGLAWNANEMYSYGSVQATVGKLAGGPRTYFQFTQGVKLAEKLALNLWMERDYIGEPSVSAATHRQAVLSLTYDLDPTQGITARAVRLDGQNNISAAYRRRVSSGTDAYIIYGDPNVTRTKKSLMVKLVRPMW